MVNGYTSRFLGFSLYISNTTNKNDGVLCYKDTLYTKATIPNPINITCEKYVSGRIVIYYNNRTDSPFPHGYSTQAFNDRSFVISFAGDNHDTIPTPIFTITFSIGKLFERQSLTRGPITLCPVMVLKHSLA